MTYLSSVIYSQLMTTAGLPIDVKMMRQAMLYDIGKIIGNGLPVDEVIYTIRCVIWQAKKSDSMRKSLFVLNGVLKDIQIRHLQGRQPEQNRY